MDHEHMNENGAQNDNPEGQPMHDQPGEHNRVPEHEDSNERSMGTLVGLILLVVLLVLAAFFFYNRGQEPTNTEQPEEETAEDVEGSGNVEAEVPVQ